MIRFRAKIRRMGRKRPQYYIRIPVSFVKSGLVEVETEYVVTLEKAESKVVNFARELAKQYVQEDYTSDRETLDREVARDEWDP